MFGSSESVVKASKKRSFESSTKKEDSPRVEPLFCFLDAATIVEILNRKPAFLSGGLDKGGAPILSVVNVEGSSESDLRDVISYLGTVPNEKLRPKGLTIIVDGRRCSIDEIHTILAAIQNSTVSKRLNAVFIVRKDGLKEKHKISEIKKHSFNFDFVIMHLILQKLYKYAHPFQLTEDFGGSLAYSHKQWLKKRLAVEKYLKECSTMSKHIESCHNLLSHRSVQFESENAQTNLQEAKMFYEENGHLPTAILENGDKLLIMLTTDLDTGFKSKADAIRLDVNGQSHEQVHQAMSHLKNQQNKFHQLWLETEHYLQELNDLLELEKDIQKVSNWLKGKGENGLFVSYVGCSYSTAVALLKEHQEVELWCTQSFGQYAEICNKVMSMHANDHSQFEIAETRKNSLDHLVKRFALCLQRKRDIVETAFKFFSQIQQINTKIENSKTTETKELGSLLECECALHKYKNWMESTTIAEEEALRLGSNLIEMLQKPFSTPNGCQAILDPNRHITSIKRVLEVADSTSRIFMETLDVQKLRATQELQLYQCERDAKQAVSWIEDLCSLMTLSNTQIGANVKEVEQSRFEHQKLEETAKGAYDYGRKLLESAVFLRQSFEFSLLANTYIANLLIANWQKFLCGSQERTVRLSLVRTLYLTFEKLSERLDLLRNSIEEDLTAFGQIRKHWIARRHRQKWTRIRFDLRQTKKATESLIGRLEKPVIQGYRNNNYVRDETTVEEIESHIASLKERVEAMETKYFSDEALSSSDAHSYVTARSSMSSTSTITGISDDVFTDDENPPVIGSSSMTVLHDQECAFITLNELTLNDC